jgi:hypothetical protein
MAQDLGNSPKQQAEVIAETLLSVGARISETIKDAIQDAVDGVDATIYEKLGNSLTSSFSKLAKFSEEAANNTFKISEGLLNSDSISKQLLSLEEKKLAIQRQLSLAKEILQEDDINRLQTAFDQTEKILEVQKKLLQEEKAITDSVGKRVGLVGKLAGALGAIPGLGNVINAKEVDAALRKAAVQLDENGNLVESGTGKFKMMAIAAKTVGKQFATAMFDPAVIVGKIAQQFLAINKASVELRRLTGDTVESFGDFSTGAAGAVEILETAAQLTQQTGLNAQMAFSGDVIAQAASLKVEMGLAADEAGGIAVMAQTSGQSVDGMVESIVASTSAFNGANRSAVSQGVILKDVAKASAAIKASLGSNPKALADAASQAKLLATDLNGLNQMASSLLDFESSIEAELEAQLLTGNQLNLSKARELALKDDLVGVGKEIFKNTVDIEKFGEMGRLGQEAQAKALGISRDQLAQIAFQTALNNGMTDEAAAKAANVNAEDMKRITAMENFTLAINKVVSFFAPVLDFVSNIFSIPLFGPLVAGAAVAIPALILMGGQLASLIGLFTAKTAAIVINTGAVVSNEIANSGLAGSQILLGTTGTAASGGFTAMGAALKSFGAAAATAIPTLLTIAAVAAGIGLAFAGVGFALMQIPAILKEITLEKAAAVAILATSFASLAAGLAAVALAGPMALPVLLATGALAAGIGMIATAGGASPGGAAIAGAQKPVESPQAPATSLSLDPLVTEIKLMREEMTSLMKQVMGREIKVYLDGYLVGQGTQQAQTSSG